MGRRFDVYGVGNAIMDLQLQVQEADIQKLALTKGGMKLVDPLEQKKLLEYFHGFDLHQASGGSAANTMIAISQLGGCVSYACVVGDDAYGQFYLKEMEELGVKLHTEPLSGKTTGTCVILISPDAERTMNTHLGASVELDVEHLDESAIADSKWVYIEGYLFSQESGQRVAKRAAELAKKHGTKIAVTFSDGFIIDFFGAPLREVVKDADLVFANLTEASKFTGETEPALVFEKFASQFPSAVVTMSEKGARVRFGGEDFSSSPFSVKAIDDTGAGDIFAGGFLHGITHGMKPDQAGNLACFLASRVVSQLGPRLLCDVKELVSNREFLSASL